MIRGKIYNSCYMGMYLRIVFQLIAAQLKYNVLKICPVGYKLCKGKSGISGKRTPAVFAMPRRVSVARAASPTCTVRGWTSNSTDWAAAIRTAVAAIAAKIHWSFPRRMLRLRFLPILFHIRIGPVSRPLELFPHGVLFHLLSVQHGLDFFL